MYHEGTNRMLYLGGEVREIVRDQISEEMTLKVTLQYEKESYVTNGGKKGQHSQRFCSGEGLLESRNWRNASAAGM